MKCRNTRASDRQKRNYSNYACEYITCPNCQTGQIPIRFCRECNFDLLWEIAEKSIGSFTQAFAEYRKQRILDTGGPTNLIAAKLEEETLEVPECTNR